MSNPKWLEKYLKMKPEVDQIFDDLDRYRAFCVEYGLNFEERHLYNERSPWSDYQRSLQGKWVRNRWYQPDRPKSEFRPRDGQNRNFNNRNYQR